MNRVPLPRFVDSAECRTRRHCGTCRDVEWGKGFRRSVAGGDFDCPHVPWGYDPADPAAPPGLLAKVARGAAGLAKAALGIDKAPDDVTRARLLACARCANWTGNTCGLCGCYTAMKARIAGEACPLGWWLSVPPAAGE